MPRIRGTRHRGCGTRTCLRSDVEFLIGEGIAHAKSAKVAKVGKGFQMSECVNVRRSECRFVVASLARGGISEAASLGEQSWMLKAGVVETARSCGPDAGPDADRGRSG